MPHRPGICWATHNVCRRNPRVAISVYSSGLIKLRLQSITMSPLVPYALARRRPFSVDMFQLVTLIALGASVYGAVVPDLGDTQRVFDVQVSSFYPSRFLAAF